MPPLAVEFTRSAYESLGRLMLLENYKKGIDKLGTNARVGLDPNYTTDEYLNGEYHEGVDYQAAVGVAVYSPVSGTVVGTPEKPGILGSTGWANLGVVTVKVDGTTQRYMHVLHLSKASVNVGDIVSPGCKLGEAGKTSIYSIAAHLHVGLRGEIGIPNPGKSADALVKGNVQAPTLLVTTMGGWDLSRVSQGLDLPAAKTCTSTPAPAQCSPQWGGTALFKVGEVETQTSSCQSDQRGSITRSHTCMETGQWGPTSEVNQCSFITCTASWGSSRLEYGVGMTETYERACLGGFSGSITDRHTCTATGWSATATTDTCRPATSKLPAPTIAIEVPKPAYGGLKLQVVWTGVNGVAGYNVYRNGNFITFLPPSPPQFKHAYNDYDSVPGKRVCYELTSVENTQARLESERSNQACLDVPK